jgi:Dolichyl-phosphate-mannose-protein mannosyltransferase
MRETETVPIREPDQLEKEKGDTAPEHVGAPDARRENRGRLLRGLGLTTWAVLLFSLAALVPTVGDFGLTWDEPAYRYSQMLSAQWWEQVSKVHSWREVEDAFEPLNLLYYWPYGRHGINFHPPLAGQLNLAAHAVFGHWMKDIPSRRMASVIEFALTITIGFHFLARRYGSCVGLVMAGSLLLMPRLYGQAHLMDTDTPGLLIWSATAVAFWTGLHEPHAWRWRMAVGILLGLAFIEKMGAVMVLLPLLLWLIVAYLPRTFTRSGGRFDWIDGTLTTGAMLAPLGLAFQQIQILQQQLPPPDITNLFVQRPVSDWPGAILAMPLAVWCVRRLFGWLFPKNKIWGVERPALETWTAILAFAPMIGWLGNPAWWRETLPRLTHYYTLNVDREHSLPPIQIIYFGQIYKFSLPWHNAWVLIGITVPVAILVAGVIGLLWAISQVRRDRLPFYFLVHFLTLPVIRMFPTPAHDGVRLLLPAFFFLSAFAGWGTVWLADAMARRFRFSSWYSRRVLLGVVLGSAAFSLVRIHPYELSYYNELIGGPHGAWDRGFELSYWYDAFNAPVIADLNRRVPPNAEIDFFNDLTTSSVIVFQELQSLGVLRGDIGLAATLPRTFPFIWLLTQDSKAVTFTRLLFAMRPWYASYPRQLGGARVATVGDPVAVSRAYALKLLLEATDQSVPAPSAAPLWVRAYIPLLARFWGDGLIEVKRLALDQNALAWSRSDPAGLMAAARKIAAKKPNEQDENSQRLMELMTAEATAKGPRHYLMEQLLNRRPQALVEAIEILNSHRDEVVKVMTRYGYTDPQSIGGYLDRDLPAFEMLSIDATAMPFSR